VSASINGKVEQAGVHVVVRQDSVILEAVPPSGPVHMPVTFTPKALSGRTVSVGSWAWTPLVAPGQTLACPSGDATCTVAVRESGTMSCAASVAGLAFSASARVDVILCPTNDEVLNNKPVRDGLLAAWNGSQYGQGSGKEQGGWIQRHGATGAYRVIPVNDPNATDCQFSLGAIPIASGGWVTIAGYHTHPHNPSQILSGCPNGRPLSATPYTNGGGSDKDWDEATRIGGTIYVVNPREVVRLDPQTPKHRRSSNPNRHPRLGACPFF
jgi:hypothetical protein